MFTWEKIHEGFVSLKTYVLFNKILIVEEDIAPALLFSDKLVLVAVK